MSSTALADLSGRLREVQVVAALDPARQGDTTKHGTSNAISKACLVLLSAHLEGFLEDLVDEALDTLAVLAPPVEQLPLRLRALHAESHLKEIDPINDPDRRAARIERMFKQEFELWVDGTSLKNSHLRPATVRKEMSNPGSTEIRHFLKFLDVDLESHLAMRGQMQLLGRVDGLVGQRNQVAHGDLSVTATFQDIDSYSTIVQQLCVEADDAVGSGLMRTCRLHQKPW